MKPSPTPMFSVINPTLCKYDYEFLAGTWERPHGGAAWNVVSTFCRNAGFGGYNDPTEKGRAAMKEWESEGTQPETNRLGRPG